MVCVEEGAALSKDPTTTSGSTSNRAGGRGAACQGSLAFSFTGCAAICTIYLVVPPRDWIKNKMDHYSFFKYKIMVIK